MIPSMVLIYATASIPMLTHTFFQIILSVSISDRVTSSLRTTKIVHCVFPTTSASLRSGLE